MAILPLALVLTACASPSQPSAQDKEVAGLRAQQQDTEKAALDAAARRSCLDTPTMVELEGLPDEALACLGSGPDRAVNSGDGRATVINLWASWCAPCVEEMPLLERTATRYEDQVRFIGIDTQDKPASAAGLLVSTGVTYDQYEDPQGVVRNDVRAFGLPVTLVFDASGREVARKLGQVDQEWLDESLQAASATPDPSSGEQPGSSGG